MRPVFVLSAARTPIGRFGGAFSGLTAADLGEAAAKAALERSGLPPAAIGETIFGHARQAGGGPNTARQVSHRAGIPDSVPAFTVNKACASSLKAITLGALTIAAGENELVLAGGTECMSATPYLLPRARFGSKMGHTEVVDAMYRDGFLCPLCGQLMGETAETLAREYGILRAEQDAYAAESQRRAGEAIRAGRFAGEIAPVSVPGKSGPVEMAQDEHPRPDTTAESLGETASGLRSGGHGPRRQFLRDHGRRRGRRSRHGRGSAEVRRRTARPRRGVDVGGRRSGADGHRAGAGDSQAPRQRRASRSPTSISWSSTRRSRRR